MSWAKILLLLGIIAVIHLVVIYGCVYSGEDGPAATDPAVAAGRNELFGKIFTPVPESSAGQTPAEWLNKPDTPKKLLPKSLKVKPWVYGKTLSLPRNLANQAKRARSGIVVELDSRQVLWEKDSRKSVAIASLTKLMSALLVAEKLADNDPAFTPGTNVKLSKTAAAEAYRKFDAGDQFTVKELIQAMIIGSSNDAAAQLAECVSGSVEVFVADMNVKARRMGLDSAEFNSPNGLPRGKQKINSTASVADVLHLCEAVMSHKIIMDACGENHAKLANGRELYTTNGLLLHPRRGRTYYRRVPGLIGFKTGYTNAAGFCLAFGATRDGKTILGCVTGFPSAADRERFCSDLIEWAYKTEQVKK